ncbi:MAG: alpha/beta hydrolase [Tagaea sp.]|nr:alpha/beta hydrolase [Tagaea sp.]
MLDLDPEIAAALAESAKLCGPAPEHLPHDPAAARADQEKRRAPWNLGGPVMRERRDMTLDLPGRAVPARFFVPEGNPRGLLVWLHGGGWVIGSLDTHDRLCRALAEGAGARVLSIGYRKAPEYPYPAPLDDACDAFLWARAHAQELGIEPAKIALGGDSAGANLAFGAAQRLAARGLPGACAHASIYGVFDRDLQTPSYRTLGDGRLGLSQAGMAMYWDLYCPDADLRATPELSPLRGDLRVFARPFLLAAGLDPLRDDSRKMRDALLEAGMDTAYVEFPRANHGFAHLGARARVSRDAIAAVAAHLARAFSV